MKKMLVSTLVLACLTALQQVAVADPPVEPRTIVSFRTMYGVDGPFLGASNAIRGVPGDDLPWEVRLAIGSLNTNGHLKILVRGLVFKDEESVPEEKRGINDEPNFRGVVSCLTEADDAVPTVNVATRVFRATATGNANIEETIELPNPCVAPVVFVTGEDPDKWFAVTGFEKEEEGEE